MTQSTQSILSLREAADKFGLAFTRLRNAAKEGALVTRRVGRATVVDLADVEAWLRAQPPAQRKAEETPHE